MVMIEGFQKYLVDNGWVRTKYVFGERVVDNESNFVSGYGTVDYRFEKDGKKVYWGLFEKGMPPRWSFDPQRKTIGMPNEEIVKLMDTPNVTSVIMNGGLYNN